MKTDFKVSFLFFWLRASYKVSLPNEMVSEAAHLNLFSIHIRGREDAAPATLQQPSLLGQISLHARCAVIYCVKHRNVRGWAKFPFLKIYIF